MTPTDQKAFKFFVGVTLYATQAWYSLTRVTHFDPATDSGLEGLRAFYAARPQPSPSDLAKTLLWYKKPLPPNVDSDYSFSFFRGAFRNDDRWMMGRLLLDFSNVLRGGQVADYDLSCLRYCLTVASGKFERKLGLRNSKSINVHMVTFFHREHMVSEAREIEAFVGPNWFEPQDAYG